MSFVPRLGSGIHAVNLTAAAQLRIEKCQITGFVNNGINAVVSDISRIALHHCGKAAGEFRDSRAVNVPAGRRQRRVRQFRVTVGLPLGTHMHARGFPTRSGLSIPYRIRPR